MKNATKATLWSALVFPGAGHLLLKRYGVGLFFIVPALISLYLLIVNAVTRARAITDKILSGEVPADATVIAELIARQSAETQSLQLDLATAVLIGCWLMAMVDAYRIGRLRDLAASA